MDFLKDLKIVQLNTLKRSLKSFSKNWIIIFTGFIYTMLNIVIFTLINLLFTGVFSIIAGVIAAIVTSSLISNYLYLLFNIVKYDKITLDNFKDGFKIYLRKIYGIFFIAWIASFLLNIVDNIVGSYTTAFYSVIGILAYVIFNPLPEVVYQKHYSSYESIGYSFEFMKTDWFNWLLPNVIFGLILYKLSGVFSFDVFRTHIEYSLSLKGIGKYLLNQVIFSYVMIYRGHLFNILSNSTRRKRMYMAKLND